MSTANASTVATPPIRVLHLYRRFAPDFTGDGLYYQRLIPHMQMLGTTHAVLATETRGGAPEQTLDGLPVHYLPESAWGGQPWALHRWLLAHAHTFDVLHLHTHVDWRLSAYVLARALGKQVVFSCSLDDSPLELLAHYNPFARPIARLLLRSINVFVAISPRLYRQSVRAVAPERVCYIPQGIEDHPGPGPWPETRHSVRQSLGVADSDVLLLSVGSICERKNAVFLVDMLARIPDPRVKLVLVGPVLEPAYGAQLQARIAQAGLRDRVIEVGFHAEPTLFYRAADVFVFASKSEGFCNVYLEAMCHGLPVITRYLSGLTDYLFDHGRTGYFATELAPFTSCVQALVDDPALRQRVGQAGRADMLKHYRLQRVADRYVDLYRRLGPQAPEAADPAAPVLTFSECAQLSRGPALIGLRPLAVPRAMQPVLMVVVDTEAEFDWTKGTRDDTGRVDAMPHLLPFAERLLALGAKPCLVVDHPVATGAESAPLLRHLAAQGAELGAHLQPWTNPPCGEPLDAWHSYCGNLAPALERAKLLTLKASLQALTDAPVRTFKAGRYGAGPSTLAQLPELGFDIDLSFCPGYDMRADGGPDWSAFGSQPAWVGAGRRLLSLPTTGGYAGLLGPLLNQTWLPRRWAAQAARARLGRIHRLSPEGNDLAAMRQLANSLLGAGHRVLTISLHSPSLGPGYTPYAPTPEASATLVANTLAFVDDFQQRHGGRVLTPSAVHAELVASGEGA
jgi:teichuronic acid biosynthesis glycosyltransferase TuaC